LPAAPLHLAYQPPQSSSRRERRLVYFAGHGEIETDVYDRSMLPPGTAITGPALFEERETSCSVGPDCMVTVDAQHNLVIDIITATGGSTP
jgi:N-methylhydantoinase A